MTDVRQLPLRPRLLVGFGLLLLVFGATSAVNAWWSHRHALATIELVERSVRDRAMLAEWRASTEKNLIRARVQLQVADAAMVQALAAEMKATSARIDELQRGIEAGLADADERRAFTEVGAARKSYIDARKQAQAAQAGGDAAAASALLGTQVVPRAQTYLGAVDAMVARKLEAATAQLDAVRAATARRLAVAIASALAGTALAMALAYGLARSITRPLSRTLDAVTRMASGDLTQRLRDGSRDEVGELARQLDRTSDSIAEMLRGLREAAASVRGATGEIAAGTLDLSHRTEMQAAQLQASASTATELHETIGEHAGASQQAHDLALQAAASSHAASESVVGIGQTMQRIHQASRQIGGMVKLIDSIAFQTNILALNAAVEAARAGEQGRGFAVVATEVRNLAQRSAQSAREIGSVIDGTLREIDGGVHAAEQARSTVEDARGHVQRMKDLMDALAGRSTQHAAGLDEIQRSLSEMDAAAQQNAALVEQSGAATQQLAEQARALDDLAQRFRVA